MAGGRRVTWGDLDVHYFDYGLGDSPAVSCGVAVRLGAALAARPEKARLRDAERHSPPRWLEPATRRALLREAGFSEGDIEAARKRIVEDQRRRIQSLPPLHYLEQLPWFVARSVRRKIRKRFQAFRDKRRAAPPPASDLIVPVPVPSCSSAAAWSGAAGRPCETPSPRSPPGHFLSSYMPCLERSGPTFASPCHQTSPAKAVSRLIARPLPDRAPRSL